jgi:tape measure domain-containing protein
MTTYTLSIVVEGKDQASGPLGRVGSALSNMSQIVGGIIGAQLLTQLGQGLASLGKNAFFATAEMQQFDIGLSTLIARELRASDSTLSLNNALSQASPIARDLAEQLRELALTSPFELGTVQETFRVAMAFGATTIEAKKLTNGILNMAAGVGANNEMLGRMSFNFAQIRRQGSVTALDIRQLALAGFDLVGALQGIGKQFGIAIETHEDFNRAIKSGELTWEQFATGFEKYANEEFGGASERISKTLFGLSSNFKDLFLLTMPRVLGPAAEMVTDHLNKMMDSFKDFSKSGVLEQMGRDFADFLDSPFFKNGFMGLTRGFEHWAQQTDWAQVSADIISGIESIDWSYAGARFREGLGNILNGLGEIIQEGDWGGILGSAANAFADFWAAVGGAKNWEEVKLTWSSNGDQLVEIFRSVGNRMNEEGIRTRVLLSGAMGAAAISAVGAFVSQAALGLGRIVAAISEWLPAIEAKLIQLKEIFKNQFNQMIGAAINILLGYGKKLVEALQNLLSQLQSLIKPINIIVALPDFVALAAQAAAGMAMLNDALSGGTTGSKGKPPRPEVNTAGGAGGGSTIGFSEGGVARGPRSGYQVTLHGTEAVIPLSGGRTVPVEFNGALNALRGEMQTMNGTGGNSGAGSPITIIVNGANDPEAVAKEIFGLLKAQGVLA